MHTWYDYRTAWSRHPWMLAIAVLDVAVLGIAVVATVEAGPLAFLFIPALAIFYMHHLLATKMAE